eukprot:COSAG01_NODE_7362_length_3236_cov_20.995537_2_plen_127_part_00
MPRTPPHVTLCFPRVLRAIVVVRMQAFVFGHMGWPSAAHLFTSPIQIGRGGAQGLLSECQHLCLATWDGQVRRIPSQAPYKLVGGARKGCCPNARGSHQDARAAAHPSWPSPKDSANSDGRRPLSS